ncbi:cytochrome P450 [Asanoa siamensis]|uniref:Cytochrome P450 138 n=1 Tax=Asanoa siamensis TaxID=926357 RepID=A0ABQ4CMD0_9ACTN|nr:cytochrome P450 [Asanoa siamensis]GIF72451.1 putative cytochrome P450 138 [Asanoa siamensis]
MDPPVVRLPKAAQAVGMVFLRRRFLMSLRRRYGTAYVLDVPPFGRTLVVSDPAALKQLFTAAPDIAGTPQPNLGRMLGSGSIFGLDGEPHRARRKVLVPPFHGRRMQAYAGLIEEEFRREAATWPLGREFATQDAWMRITLNVILRAVFGADGAELTELRATLPTFVTYGSKLSMLPVSDRGIGPWNPWRRFREYRAAYDRTVQILIDRARADERLDERDDILAMLLQSRYDDGAPMSDAHVKDELLTLLAAGHETTATTLAWAMERLSRHPAVLHALVDDLDGGGTELLQATILELQRVRPVVINTARRVNGDGLVIGGFAVPRGWTVLAGIDLVQSDERVFPHPRRFDPTRFVGEKPATYAWIPFGGGTRRCVGAAFANLEMTVVLRALLRDFELRTTYAPGERWHARGVAYAPDKGGRVVVHRRTRPVRGRAGERMEVTA